MGLFESKEEKEVVIAQTSTGSANASASDSHLTTRALLICLVVLQLIQLLFLIVQEARRCFKKAVSKKLTRAANSSA